MPERGPAGRVRIGISGWTYRSWRGDFYPPGLVHRGELAYVAERLGSIEINASFYSLQRPSSYLTWREQTPDGFVFAVKGGRFVTHMKQLLDIETALANFFASGVLALGNKLGPLLWQLPQRMRFDADRLNRFFELLPRTTMAAAALAAHHNDKVPTDRALIETEVDLPIRHAVEPRSEDFGSPAALEVLRANDIALVASDGAGAWPLFTTVTADFAYVRLHGSRELYASGYDDGELARWADRIRRWAAAGCDVYVYFDNDARGYAPHDALRLQALLAGRP